MEVLVGRASKGVGRRVESGTPKADGYLVPAHICDYPSIHTDTDTFAATDTDTSNTNKIYLHQQSSSRTSAPTVLHELIPSHIFYLNVKLVISLYAQVVLALPRRLREGNATLEPIPLSQTVKSHPGLCSADWPGKGTAGNEWKHGTQQGVRG